MAQPAVGVYISVPFCKAKCTYCNFASGVFGAERMEGYVERVCAEMAATREHLAALAQKAGIERLSGQADSVFMGGGTPSLLEAEQLRRLFAALRAEFEITKDAEVTLECAPGQLRAETLEELLRQGMNRVSFGVQSFVDREAAAVGRLHTRKMCLSEIARLRAAGVGNINVDLIAGLPGQTTASWRQSVDTAIESEVPHVSVYMLEVDEESRLGREMLGERKKYGAESVATDDEIADWYGAACEWLEAAGVKQYEISNFARYGRKVSGWRQKDNDGDSDSLSQNDASKKGAGLDYRSWHNMKYWRREPYVGYGLDAHSMLRTGEGAVRWANGDDLDEYLAGGTKQETGNREQQTGLVQIARGTGPEVEVIGREKAFEEALFLGLRMNVGVDLESLRAEFGEGLVRGMTDAMEDAEEAGLAERDGSWFRLTARGRMASNEVFGRLLVGAAV